MAEVKWIKICTDIFDDEKIILIESMPDSYAIITAWFKLLCLAGKQNNSGVFMLNDRIPYTEEMLATIFRMPLNTVRLALDTFERFGMIETINGVITIPNWEKHQSLEKLQTHNEYMKNYMRDRREKQKQIVESSSVNNNVNNSKLTVNAADIEEDKELDKDIENKIYRQVVLYLNEKAETNYKATSSKTKTLIHARLAEGFTLEDFQKVIDKKCREWRGTDWEKFLRPETLFGSKFEGYLNAKEKADGRKPVYQTAEKDTGTAGKFSFLDPD